LKYELVLSNLAVSAAKIDVSYFFKMVLYQYQKVEGKSFKIRNYLRSCFKAADFKDSQGGIPLDDPRDQCLAVSKHIREIYFYIEKKWKKF